MKMYQILIVFAAFVWSGALISISFMEAPLKFQAPGISTELGLGIGRIVFHALNKMEWLMASVILIGLYFTKGKKIQYCLFAVALCILIYQTFLLLPQLDERASQLLGGNKPEASYHHVLYIVLEAVKLISIVFFAIHFLNHQLKQYDTSGSFGINR